MADGGASGGKILLVEDDEGVRLGLVDVLEDRAPVREAATLKEAMVALSEEPFALVIADLRLGHRADAGKQVLEAARRMLTPVAVVSGMTVSEIEEVVAPHRADAILPKPFQVAALTLLVDRFLEARERVLSAQEGSASSDQGPVRWHRVDPDAVLEPSEHPRYFRVVKGDVMVQIGEAKGSRMRCFHLAARAELRAGAEGATVVSSSIEVPPPHRLR